MENLRIWEICNPSPIQSSFPVKLCCYTFRWDGLKEERRRGGNRQTVQNMLDAIFGVQLSGHLRFSHEWRCVRCYSEDHYTRHTPPLHLALILLASSHSRLTWTWSAFLCRFPKNSVTMMSVVGWQVSNQDWKCGLPNMDEFGAADHFPRDSPVELIRRRPSGPFTGLTSHQPSSQAC